MACDELHLVTLPHIPDYIKYVTAQSNNISFIPNLYNTQLDSIDLRDQIHGACVQFDVRPRFLVLGICSHARHDYREHQSNVLKYIFYSDWTNYLFGDDHHNHYYTFDWSAITLSLAKST